MSNLTGVGEAMILECAELVVELEFELPLCIYM